jgi:alpha-galactosidase
VNFGDQARPPRAALAQMQQPCCTLKSLDSPSRRQNLGRARRVERKPHPLRGAALHRRPSHRRRYDLSFRAATAVFGHLGIEWDLTAATAQELADLREWVSFYKANRWLPMGGALVRADSPDPTVMAYGIIAADRSEAIYTIASVGRSEDVSRSAALPRSRSGPPLPHPSDPRGTRAVRPESAALVGAITTEFEPSAERRALGWGLPADGGDGLVLPGAVLGFAGGMAANMHPDHAILYRAEALD